MSAGGPPQPAGQSHALVTGFSRLFARKLAAELSRGGRVTLLATTAEAAFARSFLDELPPEQRERLEVVVGEVGHMHLGLSTAEYRAVCATVTDLIHAAEESSVHATAAEHERLNIEGTRTALELASDCRRLRRFTHVSTAFVAGDRVGVIAEDELSAGQTFRNEYERTRFEAELLVRRAMGELPCVVLRPSMVVGDTRTGEIDKLEGVYTVALLLITSPLTVPIPLPGNGVAPLNAVPIDFAVSAALAIHRDARAVGRTYHLCDPNPSSARRVYELLALRAGRKLPRMSLGFKLTDALLRLPGLERVLREERTALAYVNQLAFFSTRNLLEALDGSGLRCPPIESYLDTLIGFAREELQRRKPARA